MYSQSFTLIQNLKSFVKSLTVLNISYYKPLYRKRKPRYFKLVTEAGAIIGSALASVVLSLFI